MPEAAAHLTCVKCTSVLDRAAFEGLEVDLCPACGGLWLDRGELTRAARLPETELAHLRALVAQSADGTPAPTSHLVPCPACAGKMAEVTLGNLHVDHCGTCHGIFLDRGELEEALKAARARDARVTARQVFEAAASAAQPAIQPPPSTRSSS